MLKNIIKISVLFFLLFSFCKGWAGEITYNRSKATTYASDHCTTETYNHDKYKCFDPNNSKCENYGKGGGTDCANFMSQSLIDGGVTFYNCLQGKGTKAKKGELVGGAEVIGKDGKTKGLILANDIVTALGKSYCFNEVSTSEAKVGDIIISKSSTGWVTHVMMVADNTNRYYYAHTKDRCSRDNTCYNPETKQNDGICSYSSTATILQFLTDKCKKCELNEKSCKAEVKDKTTLCQTCDPETGAIKPKCSSTGGGRCQPKVTCDVKSGMCITSQGGDCPDDTFNVGSGVPSQPVPSTSSSASVGILEAGFTYDMLGLLQSFNQDARVIQPGDISAELVNEMPLLIIPSAGLYGMESSAFLKAALDEYVKRGGTVIVFGQQHGYEFSILPTPADPVTGIAKPLTAYGWTEESKGKHKTFLASGLLSITQDSNSVKYFIDTVLLL